METDCAREQCACLFARK